VSGLFMLSLHLRGAVNFHLPQKSISGWGVPLKKMVAVRHEGRMVASILRLRQPWRSRLRFPRRSPDDALEIE
jgi:hypothetical protein